jgi:hypothetical protein
MIRTVTLMLIILCITMVVGAETVSLTGTVKKSGIGIPGVKVSLKKFPNVSANTTADGSFTISGNTAVLTQTGKSDPVQFVFRNNAIIFSPMEKNLNGYLDIFSSDGKRKFSINLNEIKNRSVAIQDVGSGINIVRITIGAESYTRELINLGDGLFLKGEVPDAFNTANFKLARRVTAAAVDTLIAAKDGYTTSKTAITSYSQQNIAITLDTAGNTTPGKCTREDLKAMTDKYIEAKKAGDPTKMPLADNVKVIVNTKDTSLAKSIFKQALKIDFNLSIYDVDSCRTFTEVIAANNNPAYVIGTRLRVKDGKIIELNAIVTDKDSGWLFDAANYLKYAKQQNWYILSTAERSTREKLVDAGNQYLDIFNGDDEGLPWGAPCYRIEGGTSTFKGDSTKDYCHTTSTEVGVKNGKGFPITNRDFVVDMDLGAVDVFCKFCVLDSHLFRLVNGKFRYVHTLTVDCPKM